MDSLQEELFIELFTHPTLFEFLTKKWNSLIKSFSENIFLKNRMKNLQMGKLYVLVLIIIDRLCKGKNKDIAE